jgi:hypothetical protein
MLNYKYTQISIAVPVKTGASITVESYLAWHSDAPNEKALQTVVRVAGEVNFQEKKWQEELIFHWPEGGLPQFEAELKLIKNHVDYRARDGGTARKEVFSELFGWLRIGWVDENGKWKAYIRFTQNALKMESEFADLPALIGFRNALVRATQP